MERLQNNGIRIILERSPRISATEMRGDLGWTTLEEGRYLFGLRLVYRCILGGAPKWQVSSISTNEKISKVRI
jgi:hypothetical protein